MTKYCCTERLKARSRQERIPWGEECENILFDGIQEAQNALRDVCTHACIHLCVYVYMYVCVLASNRSNCDMLGVNTCVKAIQA